MEMLVLSYDEEADVLYIELADGEVARTYPLGDLRLVDEARDGTVLGIEFISPSGGIDLSGIPSASEIARAIDLERLPFPVIA